MRFLASSVLFLMLVPALGLVVPAAAAQDVQTERRVEILIENDQPALPTPKAQPHVEHYYSEGNFQESTPTRRAPRPVEREIQGELLEKNASAA